MQTRPSLIAGLLILSATSALAAFTRWTVTGPRNGWSTGDITVNLIVPHPRNSQLAYASTAAGIFRTSNGGNTWEGASDGLPQGFVEAVAAAAYEDGRTELYAIVGGAVYGSVDDGDHWFPRGSLPERVDRLAVDGVNQRVYAMNTDRNDRMFVTSDDGLTWREALLKNATGIRSIAVGPDGVAYAIPQNVNRLARSFDGMTWSIVDRSPAHEDALAIDPIRGTIYVVVNCPNSCLINSNASARRISMSLDSKSWVQLPSLPWVNDLVAVGGVVYAATVNGVYALPRNSGTWKLLGNSTEIRSIAATPTDPRRLYALAPSSAPRTTLADEISWLEGPANVPVGLPAGSTASIAVAATDPTVAFAATRDGTFKSSDRGTTWTSVDDGIAYDVDVHPNTAEIAYGSGPGRASDFRPSTRKTTDGGLTWTVVTPLSGALKIAPSNPSVLYAAFANGMAKSENGGETWTAIMGGIQYDIFDFYYGFSVSSIAIDKKDAQHVFIGKTAGVYKLTDGSNWTLTDGPYSTQAVAFDDCDSSVAYAGSTAYRGLFKTEDDGATWNLSGLLDKYVTALAIHGSTIYAGTHDGHVYRSEDRGAHWSGFDEGLSRLSIRDLDIDSSGHNLYAATAIGIYRNDDVETPVAIDRLPEPRRLADFPASAIVLPVDGQLADITLVNRRDAPQDVVVMPSRGSAFHLLLPADESVRIPNAVRRFEAIAPAPFVVVAVDAAGEIDPLGNIDGSVRVWREFDDGRAPSGRSIAAIHDFAHIYGTIAGLVDDRDFQSDITIANLSDHPQQYVLALSGTAGAASFAVSVAAFSLEQFAIPNHDFGRLSITVAAERDESARWFLYGTTTHRKNGEAFTFRATGIR